MRRPHHLKKRRARQEDPSNKKIQVCDKIMSSFKVKNLFLLFWYLSVKLTPSKVSCKNVWSTRWITKGGKLYDYKEVIGPIIILVQ